LDIDGRYTYSDIVSIVGDKTVESVSLFPNPTTGKFEILASDLSTEEINVEIFDRQGRLVFAQKVEAGRIVGGRLSIDITSLQTGVYMVSIDTGNTAYRKKLVKIN